MKRVPSVELHDLVDDLLGRLPGDRLAADVAVRLADARPQQAQVVVDLGDRADRRPRVARGRLLVDRDRRRQALDRVDVGLVHLAQELARVGAQRLDVAALALGVDRVERERRLARPRQPRDDHERVARERERDVLEVVLARARDDDRVLGGIAMQCSQPNRRSPGRLAARCGRSPCRALVARARVRANSITEGRESPRRPAGPRRRKRAGLVSQDDTTHSTATVLTLRGQEPHKPASVRGSSPRGGRPPPVAPPQGRFPSVMQ